VRIMVQASSLPIIFRRQHPAVAEVRYKRGPEARSTWYGTGTSLPTQYIERMTYLTRCRALVQGVRHSW
jgi:hypothetical protein